MNQKMKMIRTAIAWLSISLFICLSFLLAKESMLGIDQWLLSIMSAIEIKRLSAFMSSIIHLGSPFVLAFFSMAIGLLLLLMKRIFSPPLFVFLVPIAALVMNRALKGVYQRERPSINMHVEGIGFSFPSGLVFYGALSYFIAKSSWKRRVKWLLASMLSMIILLIGMSRVYFRVHYPSDVLGGYAFGLAFLLLSILIFEKFEAKQR